MGDIAYETMEDYRARIRELEEENKNMEEELDDIKHLANKYFCKYKNVDIENTKLKEELRGLRDEQYNHGEPVVSSGPCLRRFLATRRRDKLVELLNEFNKEKIPEEFKEILPDELEYTCMDFFLTKKAGFIKRLVENDKIDLLQIDNRIALSEFNKVERVLMALSIQDNPIEFLISILK